MREIAYVGIDVDDKAYHVGVVDQKGRTLDQFVTKPCASKLAKVLKEKLSSYAWVCCYEATYVGFTLQRKLTEAGLNCSVIAPTSIPRSANERVKNDRIDALKLAFLFSKDSLVTIAIPTIEQQSDRSLLRSREKVVSQRSDLKRHILSICRDAGLDYFLETNSKTYWTKRHRNWLDQTIATLPTEYSTLKITLINLLSLFEFYENTIHSMDLAVEKLAEKEIYRTKVEALICFKGIQVQTAMLILCEIFDIHRFAHPKQLVSYLGLDVREYSSGGKQKQFGISKMGNRRVRKALVESCQMFGQSASPTKRLLARRKGEPAEVLRIAEKAQTRLYKKGHRLLAVGKHRNVAKVACVRELVGFIWAALKVV